MLIDEILSAAVALAQKEGLQAITRKRVAGIAGCAVGTVNYHFKAMELLRNSVIDYALKNEVIEVLAQARAQRHPRLTGRLTTKLKQRVAQHIAGK